LVDCALSPLRMNGPCQSSGYAAAPPRSG
jgi:hypothetical protein